MTHTSLLYKDCRFSFQRRLESDTAEFVTDAKNERTFYKENKDAVAMDKPLKNCVGESEGKPIKRRRSEAKEGNGERRECKGVFTR